MATSRSLAMAMAVAVCFLLQGCFSVGDKISLGFLEKARHCFDDHNVYNECAAALRLSVDGAFHVGEESVDEYCGGACLAETELALQCAEEAAAVDGQSFSFRFSNGASVPELKEALGAGCSYTPQRGIFEIREREECGEYHYLHGREPEHPGEQQYQGDDDDHYCSGAGAGAGSTQRLFFVVVSAALLAAI